MKAWFSRPALFAACLILAPGAAYAGPKAKAIEGAIKTYECGDNCYLTIVDAAGVEHTGLCVAPECDAWNKNAAMPKKFVGRRVKAATGRGDQLDADGKVMGKMLSFTKLTFSR
jgi:hypothetical protein